MNLRSMKRKNEFYDSSNEKPVLKKAKHKNSQQGKYNTTSDKQNKNLYPPNISEGLIVKTKKRASKLKTNERKDLESNNVNNKLDVTENVLNRKRNDKEQVHKQKPVKKSSLNKKSDNKIKSLQSNDKLTNNDRKTKITRISRKEEKLMDHKKNAALFDDLVHTKEQVKLRSVKIVLDRNIVQDYLIKKQSLKKALSSTEKTIIKDKRQIQTNMVNCLLASDDKLKCIKEKYNEQKITVNKSSLNKKINDRKKSLELSINENLNDVDLKSNDVNNKPEVTVNVINSIRNDKEQVHKQKLVKKSSLNKKSDNKIKSLQSSSNDNLNNTDKKTKITRSIRKKEKLMDDKKNATFSDEVVCNKEHVKLRCVKIVLDRNIVQDYLIKKQALNIDSSTAEKTVINEKRQRQTTIFNYFTSNNKNNNPNSKSKNESIDNIKSKQDLSEDQLIEKTFPFLNNNLPNVKDKTYMNENKPVKSTIYEDVPKIRVKKLADLIKELESLGGLVY